jgi:mRNA interferase RelE/StbE
LVEYLIRFAASAAKEFRDLPGDLKSRLEPAIDSLARNPRPPGTRKIRSEKDLYRVRVGSYRIVYEVHDHDKLVVIMRIRHRREAYR